METVNGEYYLLVADSSYPALKYIDPDYDLDRDLILHKCIEQPEEPFDLYLRPPVSRNPKLGDYHVVFGGEHVFSKRVKDVIVSLKPYNINFLSADIHLKNSYEEDFFILNSYNLITAMDKQNSIWTKSHNPLPEREVLNIDKLVLDPFKIKDIPLAGRLIFSLKECKYYKLFHESVINEIEKLNPKGMYAVPVDAWNSDVQMIV